MLGNNNFITNNTRPTGQVKGSNSFCDANSYSSRNINASDAADVSDAADASDASDAADVASVASDAVDADEWEVKLPITNAKSARKQAGKCESDKLCGLYKRLREKNNLIKCLTEKEKEKKKSKKNHCIARASYMKSLIATKNEILLQISAVTAKAIETPADSAAIDEPPSHLPIFYRTCNKYRSRCNPDDYVGTFCSSRCWRLPAPIIIAAVAADAASDAADAAVAAVAAADAADADDTAADDTAADDTAAASDAADASDDTAAAVDADDTAAEADATPYRWCSPQTFDLVYSGHSYEISEDENGMRFILVLIDDEDLRLSRSTHQLLPYENAIDTDEIYISLLGRPRVELDASTNFPRPLRLRRQFTMPVKFCGPYWDIVNHSGKTYFKFASPYQMDPNWRQFWMEADAVVADAAVATDAAADAEDEAAAAEDDVEDEAAEDDAATDAATDAAEDDAATDAAEDDAEDEAADVEDDAEDEAADVEAAIDADAKNSKQHLDGYKWGHMIGYRNGSRDANESYNYNECPFDSCAKDNHLVVGAVMGYRHGYSTAYWKIFNKRKHTYRLEREILDSGPNKHIKSDDDDDEW